MKKMIFVVLLLMVLFGCASKPNDKKFEITGMIIDENNQPVKDFYVHCESESGESIITYTNENGLFVFPNLNKNIYYLSGDKNGYVRMDKQKYILNDESKIFCCQILSCESVLLKVIERAKTKDYQGGLVLLNSVYCEENSNEEKVFNFYKTFFEERK